MQQHIAILDFGSQYTHLITRRIRELGVRSHVYPNDVNTSELNNAIGIILSGGPNSVLSGEKLPYDADIFNLNVPILGICYGHQLIASHFNGVISSGSNREYGIADMALRPKQDIKSGEIKQSKIFSGVAPRSAVWMSHGDHVKALPENFEQIAATNNNSIAAMVCEQKKIYGLQFHPEVRHTRYGKQILRNFTFTICRAKKNWSTDNVYNQIKKEIKAKAKNKKVFLLVSGGVDSTICFALLEKILGKNHVYGLHINNGFMRFEESNKIKKGLAEAGFKNLYVYNAEEQFLSAMKGVLEPEKKRKIIGNLFIDIANKKMEELGFNENEWLLGQGTIYPDTIESGCAKNAHKIKTHHNRVDKISKMIEQGLIIEPVKNLYKDEVRKIGEKLGLPRKLINRHPFPGPGLAIRCLCSAVSNKKPRYVNLNKILPKTKQSASCKNAAYKLPIKSVGVQGDGRSWSFPALLVNPPARWKELHQISPKITNKIKGINRVLIKIYGDGAQIKTSTLHPRELTKKRLDLLRELDQKINEIIQSDPKSQKIWQMPIILIPFGYNKGESIIIRPVESQEAMTARFAELSNDTLRQIKTIAKNKIDFVFYDITNKPPATIEWE